MTTADAAAICTAGGQKICDDRLPVRKLMQISGKRLLPRLGVSTTIPPSPHTAEPWMSCERVKGPGLGYISSSAPRRLSPATTLLGRPLHCNNQSLIRRIGELLTLFGKSTPNAAVKLARICQAVTNCKRRARWFHTGGDFARFARSLRVLRRMLGSSGLEAHLGVVPVIGRELGAVILREDAVPAEQLG